MDESKQHPANTYRRWLIPTLLLASLTAQAEVYKWTDEQGRIHYGAKPPQAAASEQVRIQRAPATSAQDDSIVERWRKVEDQQREAAAAEHEQRQREVVEKIKRVQDDARRFREQEPEFAARECFDARQMEQKLLEQLKRDPGSAYTVNYEINFQRQRQQVVCR